MLKGKDIVISYKNIVSLRKELYELIDKHHPLEVKLLKDKSIFWKGSSDQLAQLYNHLIKNYISDNSTYEKFKSIFNEKIECSQAQ